MTAEILFCWWNSWQAILQKKREEVISLSFSFVIDDLRAFFPWLQDLNVLLSK